MVRVNEPAAPVAATFDASRHVVLPGLVNAHCHLDFTDMAGQLPPPQRFTDWIAAIMAARTAWGYSDYARSWLRGAHQLLDQVRFLIGAA